jgi:3-oxoacyl-[acyl-carrier protein] reductase
MSRGWPTLAITLSYPKGGALVTGGTGCIGEGIVRRLCAAGLPLVFTYKSNADAARALEAELRAQGYDVFAQRMDMGDLQSIDSALARVVELFGRVHTVSCGSGEPVTLNRLMDFPPETVEQFLTRDALGYYRVFNRSVAVLRRSGGGSITTCTTMAFRRVFDYDGISPLSKGSVEALVRQVASEEAVHGIRCNSVAIGWVLRESMDAFVARIPPRPTAPGNEQEYVVDMCHELVDVTRLGRMGAPHEAGDLFAFLASDQASYITGQSIGLDGGATL